MTDKPEIVSAAELNGWGFLADNHCILEPSDAKRLIHTVRELLTTGQELRVAQENWRQPYSDCFCTIEQVEFRKTNDSGGEIHHEPCMEATAAISNWDALIKAHEGRQD